jgi:simple sugar transport system permease protein
VTVDTRPPRTDSSAGYALRTTVGGLAKVLLFPVMAALIAFAIGAVVILLAGQNPVEAYAALLRGGFGSRAALGRTLLGATPLIFTGLAVAVAFRAGLFNIGGEGQLYMGAIAAAWLGVALPGPGWLVIVLAIAGAGLAGFVWGAVPGLLKTLGAHEVITTIMLNFVAVNLTVYLALNPLSGESTVPGTATVDEARRLLQLGGGLGRANYGLLLGVLAAVVAYLLLWRTTKGFEIRAVGLAPEAARYAGIPVAANGVLAIALGGLFAGMGGGIEVLGTYGRLSIPFVANLGFNGIGVALLGRNHPAGVVLGALFFGGLAAGAQEMQFSADVPLDLADVLLAIVLLFVTAVRLVELLLRHRAGELTAGQTVKGGLAS